MKKFILFIILLFTPLFVYAEDIDYDITDYYVKANILDDGNMEVSEIIVLDGTFNGYERDIAFKNNNLMYSSDINYESDEIYNATGISNYSAYAKYISDVNFDTFNEEFTKLIPVDNTYNATKGDVYITEYSNFYRFRMYHRTDNRKTAFLIKYTVDNAVVMHNDVAELYWTFIGEDFEDSLNNVNIRVYLPEQDQSDNFRVWAHGDLTGEIYKYNKSYVEATVDRVQANSAVDIRMTFDKSLIKDSSMLDHNDEDALDEIIKVETKRADEANRQRQIAKVIYYVFLGITAISVIYQLISIYVIYKLFDKEYKSDFINDYNREFIEDYDVEVVEYIMDKNVGANAMSASIMNLIYKKKIKVERIAESKKEEYKFTLIDRENVSDAENHLINFLFIIVGDKESFTTKQLKQYAKSTKTYDTFTSNYTTWNNKVTKIGKSLNIYESHWGVGIYSFLYLLLAAGFTWISLFIGAFNFFMILNIILSIGIFIYTLIFKKRTKYGNEQYVRWKAFKRFLEDFGDFENKELPEISLWEKYMVYATVFGIAEKVAKVMNVKIKEMQVDNTNIDTDFGRYYYHCNLSNYINSAVTSAISQAAATAAAEIAKSAASSGSGSGGGFSSGGGFGGGGGGGRGF